MVVETSHEARPSAEHAPAKRGRFQNIAMIVIFDVAAPLGAYSLLRSAGLSTVSALLLSGVFPALLVIIGAVRNRRVDVVGVLVLAGIVVGSVLGLLSHSTKLVLVDKNGVIRGYYDGISADETQNILRDMRRLLRE